MSLEKYKEKRTFNKTPEPVGGDSTGSKLQFVVQKHQASHLHYDFRLECRGVLLSWAVPKGPSMDPSVKRLAMNVEDHPYDYKDFEGIIPEGNYGAGTVIVWDQGWYEPFEKGKTKKDNEHQVTKEFYAGGMRIVMHGKKLKGQFALIKKEGEDRSWILIKLKDSHVLKTEITKKDTSVVSGKTIEEIAGDRNAKEWESNRKVAKKNTKLKTGGAEEHADLKGLLKGARRTKMPSRVRPMLCTLTKEVESSEQYLYEIKWDGYRIISFVNGSKVVMHSRSGLDYTAKYPNVVKEMKATKYKMVLDGEMVVFKENGLPDFNALQNYNGKETPISYCVFDILWLDGYDLTTLPLVIRKQILKQVAGNSETLKYSESFDDGAALYKQMMKLDLEGIVAKKRDSLYREDARDNDWLKTPTRKRQEFVIGGWSESDKARSFRSLLFGAYNQHGEFEWIGRSGGGYKDAEMPGILQKLESLEIKASPFVNKVLDTKGAKMHWVKPQLVANFEFATWTETGRIRKPATFLGFRKDKKAKDVVREVPKEIKEIEEQNEEEEQTETKKKSSVTLKTGKKSHWPALEKIKIESEGSIEVDKCEVRLTNVERNIWKDVPKAKLIQYYHSMADYILPYIKDRPLSLHVKPNGANAPGLYIKHMEGRQPECADIFADKRRHPKAGRENTIEYIVCNNKATLLYLINLGCIDINPWMSRVSNPTEPDFVNIDLDPSDEDFTKAIDAALAAKEVLAKHKLKSFIKTSGKTGLHIYLPVQGIGYGAARNYSETLGKEIAALIPEIATTTVSISSRGKKIFIDPSQNDYADTLACAYCVRPNKIPTVSTPLDWKEVKAGLDPSAFTIDTIAARVKKKGDLFKGVFDKKIIMANSKIFLTL
jgi:bifunctional non-homologous end joining protein LigD